MRINYRLWTRADIRCLPKSQIEPSILAPSQRRVFWAIAAGHGIKSGSKLLHISESTFKNHRRVVQDKIPGLKTQADFGALATEILYVNDDMIWGLK